VPNTDRPDHPERHRQAHDLNVVIGQGHFIKTVEDLHETPVSASPVLRFGVALRRRRGRVSSGVPATTVTAPVISVWPPTSVAATSSRAARIAANSSSIARSVVPGGSRTVARNQRGRTPITAISLAFTLKPSNRFSPTPPTGVPTAGGSSRLDPGAPIGGAAAVVSVSENVNYIISQEIHDVVRESTYPQTPELDIPAHTRNRCA
jgi:hypothetical protein